MRKYFSCPKPPHIDYYELPPKEPIHYVEFDLETLKVILMRKRNQMRLFASKSCDNRKNGLKTRYEALASAYNDCLMLVSSLGAFSKAYAQYINDWLLKD